MLKIKDNVDLKELEKFGFRYNKLCECYERTKDFQLTAITTMVFPNNINYEKNQLVCQSSFWLDVLFPDERIERLNNDLIKAGLIEKVDDQNATQSY